MTLMSDNQKRDLLSDATHQLKTPLTAVKAYVDLLQLDEEVAKKHGRLLDNTMHAIHRMESIINDILDFARLEAGIAILKRQCDLRRIIDNELRLLENLAIESSVYMHVSIQDGADSVLGDESLLSQAFNNLIENAIKYNKEGGHVWITLRRQGEHVRIDIKDTGIGIPQEDIDHIFERFFRSKNSSKKRGSGLGLAISKLIVERHDGEIWASSIMNEGSTFSFVLPAMRTQGHRRHVDELGSGESNDGLDDRLQDSDDVPDEENDSDYSDTL